MNIVE